MFDRICVVCKASTTYVDKTGRHHWRFDRDELGRVLRTYCSKCWHRLVDNPKYHPIHNKRRINFKGKDIFLPYNPRTGVCSNCGVSGKRTHLHHEIYDNSDPLANTIELCQSCHSKRSWELGQITGYKLNRTKKIKNIN